MTRAAAIYKCVERCHAQNLPEKIEALMVAGIVTYAQVAAIQRDHVGMREVLVPPAEGVLWSNNAFDDTTETRRKRRNTAVSSGVERSAKARDSASGSDSDSDSDQQSAPTTPVRGGADGSPRRPSPTLTTRGALEASI